MDIIDILKQLTPYYKVIARENDSLILLGLGYEDIDYSQTKLAEIDAYYFTSNETYHKVEKLINNVRVLGKRCEKYTGALKRVFIDNGVGTVGKNTLLYIEPFGSRWYLEAIIIEEVLADENTFAAPPKMLCDTCEECAKHCPGGAIGISTFEPTRCVRTYMEGKDMPEYMRCTIGNKFMGCGICQKVCPINKKNKVSKPNKILIKILDIKYLQNKINNNELKEYKELIGNNLARKNIFEKNIKNITKYEF